jgi:acyl dehydratase
MTASDINDMVQADRFSVTVGPVTTTQLVKYAGASDDYNRIHYDQDYAKEAGLGGVIAHGMLTMGFMASAITQWGGPATRVRRICARFTSPVRPGDHVSVVCAVRSRHAQGEFVRMDCDIVASVGETEVAVGEAVVERIMTRQAGTGNARIY